MDHFENIVRILLEREGYWVVSSFKVNLTKEEKAATGKHTIPRPEIDLVAYRPKDGFVLALEVKSYLDSSGVCAKDLLEKHDVMKGRYKLFTSDRYQSIVINRLSLDLVELGFLKTKIPIKLGLAAAKVRNNDNEAIVELMEGKGWFYWSPELINKKLLH